MKEIIYTKHLKSKLQLREISNDLPKNIYSNTRERYYDKETGNNIAIDNIEYKGKEREMIVVYNEKPDRINIITIHTIKSDEKNNKIKKGRWIKI